MAVLEKETGNYYKINFDVCSVRGRRVYVAFSSYRSAEDREKEKKRHGRIAAFFNALRANLAVRYEKLLARLNESGLTVEQALSPTEDNKINKELYPELRLEQDEMNKLEILENNLSRCFYLYNDAGNEKPDYCGMLDTLQMLGYEEEWADDPVKIVSGAEVYAGDYGGEPIGEAFYYERLKSVMNENIENC